MISRFSQIAFASTAALVFWSSSTLASNPEDRMILEATSDAIAGKVQLTLLTDRDGNAETVEAAMPTQTRAYSMSEIQSGMILLQVSGHDVVSLKGEHFDPKTGGEIQLTYLNNGISGKKSTVILELERDGSGWQLYADDSAGRRAISRAFFKAKRALGKIIGIASIQFD